MWTGSGTGSGAGSSHVNAVIHPKFVQTNHRVSRRLKNLDLQEGYLQLMQEETKVKLTNASSCFVHILWVTTNVSYMYLQISYLQKQDKALAHQPGKSTVPKIQYKFACKTVFNQRYVSILTCQLHTLCYKNETSLLQYSYKTSLNLHF